MTHVESERSEARNVSGIIPGAKRRGTGIVLKLAGRTVQRVKRRGIYMVSPEFYPEFSKTVFR